MTTVAEQEVDQKKADSRMTAAQFSRIHNPHGIRMELVEGELHVSPSPRPRHIRATKVLLMLLENYVQEKGLGEMFVDLDTTLGPWDVRCPDLLFVPRERVARMNPDASATHADARLVVEVVSPGSVKIDREDKFAEYAAVGIPYYWIVDPGQRIAEGYELAGGVYRLATSASGAGNFSASPFPELQIALQPLWWD
ncbi:MAG TPA: Uma2 family endonuclease [Phycisphaerae bacterium]|nr:Uma2 family endonuclease [Phycisphaerae bacterium]